MPQDKLKIVFLHRAQDPYTSARLRYLINKGHEVFSIVFHVESRIQLPDGVKIIKLKKTTLDKIPFVKRFIHYFEIRKILFEIKPDVFHVVNALNLLYCNYKLQFVKVIENQGSDLLLTVSRFKFLVPYIKYFYMKVDGIIQDSKVLFEKSILYGAVKDDKFNRIIQSGIDFDIFNETVPKDVIRKQYSLGDRPIVLHTRGNHKLYNIDTVITSIINVKMQFPNIVYILTTSFDKLGVQLQEFIKKNALEPNILFVGFQDRIKELKFFYRDANVNVSVPSSDSSPFSVYESMACMTPNIVSDLPWLYLHFIPGRHLVTCPVLDSERLGERIIDVLYGNHKLDLSETYNIVFNEINVVKENNKLEFFYNFLLDKKNLLC